MRQSSSNEYPFIDSQVELIRFCRSLTDCDWIALDTEFLREKTYYPKLCLIQVAAGEHAACIDPIALDDISPLLDIIYDRNIIKVMHAARQDLEIFYHLMGKVPFPVFDTQIAATILGHEPQIGYASLVKKLLGVTLDKTHTRTNWQQRPLSDQQRLYAINDVVYLMKIYIDIKASLAHKNREHWLKDDMEALSDSSLYENSPGDAWRRIRVANRLGTQQLEILQALAAWREETASAKNIPRSWLCKDETLRELSRLQPLELEQLSQIKGVTKGLVNNHGESLISIIQKARHSAPTESISPAFKRLEPQQIALVDTLMAIIYQCATDNAIGPTSLTTRKEIEKLVRGDRSIEILSGWRYELIGKQLLEMLAGNLNLRVLDGKVNILPTS